MNKFNDAVRKIATNSRRGSSNADITPLLEDLKTRVDKLQTARFPVEIGAIKKSAKNYIDIDGPMSQTKKDTSYHLTPL